MSDSSGLPEEQSAERPIDQRTLTLHDPTLIDRIYQNHNSDGLSAFNDLESIRAEKLKRDIRSTVRPFAMGLTLFSAYNMSRFGVLSVPGKAVSVVGLCIGLRFSLNPRAKTPWQELSAHDLEFKQKRLEYLAATAAQQQ